MVSEKMFFNDGSMRANDPHEVVNLDPLGMIGRVYVEDDLAFQHALEKKIFSHY